jgi:hypothetical protein
MGNDESFVYIAVELAGGDFAWSTEGIQLALDTYLPGVGQHRLPRSGLNSEIGFEFVIDLTGPERARLLVTPDYQRHEFRTDPASGDDFGRFFRRPVITRDRRDGRLDSLFIITNRARFGRDGRFYPALGYDRGRLRYGTENSSTLADWYYDSKAGLLQIRIPWDLLNVTDPSTRTLLDDREITGPYGTRQAADFHIGAVLYSKDTSAQASVEALPRAREGSWRAQDFMGWRWEGWTEPRWHSRLKPVYDSLKLVWADPSAKPGRPARRAPSN